MKLVLIYNLCKTAWDKKHIIIPILVFILLLPVFLIIMFQMVMSPNMDMTAYNRVHNLKTAYLSDKNVYVNTLDLIAMIAVMEDNMQLDTISDEAITRTIDYFLINTNGTYTAKTAEQIMADLQFTDTQRERFKSYRDTAMIAYNGNIAGDISVKTGTEEERAFINRIGRAALSDTSGVLHSVTVAQAILESNWGKSLIAQSCNNLFGIKAIGGWAGRSLMLPTYEYITPTTSVDILAPFRVYASYEESIADHSKFLVENKRYTVAGVFNTSSYIEQANALQQAGYATDPSYASKLIALIKKFGLNVFDVTGEGSSVNFQALMNEALKYEGMPYTFGGTAPYAFDCSSLTQWCYGTIGIHLPRTAQEQYDVCQKIYNQEEAQPGDLIFFAGTYTVNRFITHVGIYTGGNTFYEAGGRGVQYNNFKTDYWVQHFVCFGRVAP